ncbi:MAG TPA: hypothetical protein VL335_02575 [Candidatus Paceibacterota bacterium]|jgi:hypothetical protein|nr:hypothetical protein [Candidatus Paceibacterota bacterium]
MKIIISLFLLVTALCFTGCSTVSASKHLSVADTNATPRWHTVFVPAKTNHPPIHWYNKINPVWWAGNIDEPVAPSWYEPSNSMRNLKWHMRNPFSNFANYVIGVADKDTHRSGRYPTSVGNPNNGWNFAVTRRRILFLPFWDYKSPHGRWEFYFGWRERGNFGAALRTVSSNSKKKPSVEKVLAMETAHP